MKIRDKHIRTSYRKCQ